MPKPQFALPFDPSNFLKAEGRPAVEGGKPVSIFVHFKDGTSKEFQSVELTDDVIKFCTGRVPLELGHPSKLAKGPVFEDGGEVVSYAVDHLPEGLNATITSEGTGDQQKWGYILTGTTTMVAPNEFSSAAEALAQVEGIYLNFVYKPNF